MAALLSTGLGWALLLAGFVAGLRHAMEPDHVAAVASFATRAARPSEAARMAAHWAFGHGAVILVAVAAAGWLLSSVHVIGSRVELLTAGTLLYLGRGGIRRALPRPEAHAHSVIRPWTVGAVHGLAGSGALVLGAAAGLGFASSLGYAAAFGVGALVGMIGAGLLIGLTAGPRRPALTQKAMRLADVACLGAAIELIVLAWRV